MKEFVKSAAFKVLVGIALVLVGVMIYAAKSGSMATLPATVAGAIVTPLQNLASSLSDGIDGFIGKFTDADALRAENEQLTSELNALRERQVENDELRRQNELYRDFLELKETNPDYQFVHGDVMYVDAADKYGNFTLNKGSLDGIEADAPVLTPDGLVGVVYEVGLTYSKVRTILDPETQVSAYASRTNSNGVTGGSLSLAQEGKLRLNYLTRDSGVEPGDYVVTSGKGGVYPRGLMIGKVDEVLPETDALTTYAVITPFASIRDVSTVFVLTGFDREEPT